MNAPTMPLLPGPEAALKVIPGYEELYAASRDGRIWSYPKTWISGNGTERHHDGHWLKPDTSDEYLRVVLRKNGKPRRFGIHQLVAMAFHSNPLHLPEVNHDDCNKRNNVPDNLEWCTRAENEQHAWRNGRHPLTEKQRIARSNNAKRINREGRNQPHVY